MSKVDHLTFKRDDGLLNHEAPQDIMLSDAAIAQARVLADQEKLYKNKPLRLYLDGKGCDGFFYGVAFDEVSPNDHRYDFRGVILVVDPDTLPFVKGSTIDWVDDERGQGFLVNNPNHSKYRGKFFKRKAWQETLMKKQSQPGC